jgi:hypothetical protein
MEKRISQTVAGAGAERFKRCREVLQRAVAVNPADPELAQASHPPLLAALGLLASCSAHTASIALDGLVPTSLSAYLNSCWRAGASHLAFSLKISLQFQLMKALAQSLTYMLQHALSLLSGHKLAGYSVTGVLPSLLQALGLLELQSGNMGAAMMLLQCCARRGSTDPQALKSLPVHEAQVSSMIVTCAVPQCSSMPFCAWHAARLASAQLTQAGWCLC